MRLRSPIGTHERGDVDIGRRLFIKPRLLRVAQAIFDADYCHRINTVYMSSAFHKILPGRKLQPFSKRERTRAPSVSAR
ncbi:hypothetical protein [Paraburkholderia sp.]|uniref:hypothetical protein n=1 Tax=Paraburkholderia sp. TaxID=1926495 RepID=UPI00286F7994|nr:hypothetical protein [Paraburkholderia sp.]